MYQMMQYMMSWATGGWGFVFWVTTLLIWTVLVLIIIALVRWINKK